MNTSAQSTSFHSYSSTDMEGLGNPGNVHTPNQADSRIAPANHILKLRVQDPYGVNLSTALFDVCNVFDVLMYLKDVIVGMFITQHMASPIAAERPEVPLNMMLLSESWAIFELRETTDVETHDHSSCNRVVGRTAGKGRM